MSWIYALIGAAEDTHIVLNYQEIHAKPLCVVKSSELYVAVGGIPETCIWHASGTSGWAVVGLGIEVNETDARFLGKGDWETILSQGTPWRNSLNGHFVAIRWNKGQVECFTDELGQRTLYFSDCEQGTCVSTRLDWVTKTTGRTEIDFPALGSKWLMFNQLEYDSCIVGVDRLGPRGHAVFQSGRVVRNESTPWLPEFGCGTTDQAVATLSSLLRATMRHDQQVSLGLSGGLDSRLLLAVLIGLENAKFRVHTFGDPIDPDVAVSSAIAERLGLDRTYFNDPFPDGHNAISMFKEFVAQTCLVEPGSSFLKLRYYPALWQQGRFLIDGGFGEIARRQYLNRVATLGRSALRSRDTTKLYSLMRVHRADIFVKDVQDRMERSARESLDRVLSVLPSIPKIGVENAVDLLAIRTRVPNYGSPEQARLDGDIVNFMPLVQPSFLRAIFAARTSLRSSGRFYRNLIRAHCPPLARFPLVKSGTTYGFDLSTTAAWLTTKLKAKFGKPFADPAPGRFLAHEKEYVIDLAHSSEVAGWSPYDVGKIRSVVEAYFHHGDETAKSTVDWWVTFELWRRSLTE
jgi:hypothetical protein